MARRTPPQSFAIFIAGVAVVAACQGAASPAPPASLPVLGSLRPSAAPTLGPLATPGGGQASGAASAPAGSTGGGTPPATSSGPAGAVTPFHFATELEPAVPTQADGLPLSVESVTGAGFEDANGKHKVGIRCRWYDGRGLRCRDQKELVSALAAVGKTVADVRIAVGYNETRNKEVEVQATHVAGVSGTAMRDAVIGVYRDAWGKRKTTLNVVQATIGGKDVMVITYATPYPLGLRRYLYASGDVLYDIRRAYDAPATEVLQGLP